jgi:hypothetical protein
MKHLKIILPNILIFISLILSIAISSCKNETFNPQTNSTLSFSSENIDFDTILTKTGSITKLFKVYNTSNTETIIDEIALANGKNSEFIINVNGTSGNTFKNIQIEPNDSLFIFVQANLNENSVDTLILHEDSISFSTQKGIDYIPLNAWGQDVIKHRGEVHDNLIIQAGKPHVVIDSLTINEGGSLTLEAGAKLYVHYGANIKIHGSLNLNGTKDSPITITSDRLEQVYDLLPGQWGSIIIYETCPGVTINYATIKNGVNGLLVYSNQTPVNVNISNSKLQNMSANVIWAENANIQAYNSVFANGNNYILGLQGGEHNFTHVTIFNNPRTSRTGESTVTISDFKQTDDTPIPLTSANFYNSIIIGKYSNEISIQSQNESNLNVSFNTCLVKDNIEDSEEVYFNNTTEYNKSNKLFTNDYDLNFTLDTLSQAQNIGKLEYAQGYEFDLQENSRLLDNKPDIGAYEYFYVEETTEE